MQEFEIRTIVADLVRSKTGISPQSGDTLAALNIDSLSMAELTVEIEKAFNIRVDEGVLDVENFDELVGYIKSKC